MYKLEDVRIYTEYFVYYALGHVQLPKRTWLLRGRIQPHPTQPGTVCIADGGTVLPCHVRFTV